LPKEKADIKINTIAIILIALVLSVFCFNLEFTSSMVKAESSASPMQTSLTLQTTGSISPSSSSPTFGSISSNSTFIGSTATLSCTVSDSVGVNEVIFSWNNTGSWVNQTAIAGSGTSFDAQFTGTLSSSACILGVQVYANNANNQWSTSGETDFVLQGIWLGAYFSNSTASAGDLQSTLNSWGNATGKGVAWICDDECFGTPANPVLLVNINNYQPIIVSGDAAGLQLTWQPCTTFSTEGTDASTIGLIASGSFDSYITNEADVMRNAGYPIIIRFGPEMNGIWAAWGNNNVTFVNAWQTMVNIFRQQNATNVKFFFCPDYVNTPSSRQFQYYYPGDSFVDYVGIDMYAINGYYENPYNQLNDQGSGSSVYATYSNKPFMIGEFGTQETNDSAINTWLTSSLNDIQSMSRVCGITIWNYGDSTLGTAYDNLDYYPITFETYINYIANPIYTTTIQGWPSSP